MFKCNQNKKDTKFYISFTIIRILFLLIRQRKIYFSHCAKKNVHSSPTCIMFCLYLCMYVVLGAYYKLSHFIIFLKLIFIEKSKISRIMKSAQTILQRKFQKALRLKIPEHSKSTNNLIKNINNIFLVEIIPIYNNFDFE